MSNVTHLETWGAYKEKISLLCKKEKTGHLFLNDGLLFRGQSSAEWKIESSLERIYETMPEKKYYHRIKVLRAHLISCVGNIVPEFDDRGFECNQLLSTPPGLEYLAFLRHCGFPSPLLDWTLSPFVAAFFAFSEASSFKR